MSNSPPPFIDGVNGATPRLTQSNNQQALCGRTTAARRQETTAARRSCLQQRNEKGSSSNSGFGDDYNLESDKEEER